MFLCMYCTGSTRKDIDYCIWEIRVKHAKKPKNKTKQDVKIWLWIKRNKQQQQKKIKAKFCNILVIFKFVLALKISLQSQFQVQLRVRVRDELKPVWSCLILIGILYFGNRLNVIVIVCVSYRYHISFKWYILQYIPIINTKATTD